MKDSKYILSTYNVFKEFEDFVVGINLITQIFFSIKKKKYKLLIGNKDNVSNIQKENESFFSIMRKFGIIVPSDQNYLFYETSLFQRRLNIFKSKFFRLTINPTLNCNFHCWYCYEKHTKNYMSKEVQDKVLKLTDNIISNYDIRYFHLDWFGGEPLLCYSNIVVPITKLIKNECDKHNIQFVSGITTNGYLITEKMIDFFKEVNMQSFQITLDGPEEIHNSVRFTGNDRESYKTIVRNVNLLAEKLHPENLCLRINYTLENFSNIENIIFSFPENIRPKIKILLQQVWQDEEKNQIKVEDIYKLRDKFKRSGFKTEDSFLNAKGEITCYADSLNQAVVNYDGRIFKCTALDFENELEDGILTDKGEISWNTKLSHKLVYTTFENNFCKDCTYLPVCYGPCHKKIVYYLDGEDFDKYCFKNGIQDNLNYLIEKFVNTKKSFMLLEDVESLC